ncbi:sister chromatid cohesion 1 protein 2-like [Rosa chinensis]|uniref:sister chromatid cohesion 1 protein 2-like n=1 Tax=Rosa chinensis TaxID=74649 RepID=UPI001AD8F7F0|nr:sister chromatid cohesion 1 protein 2-like [Rosa chinensis]
MASWNSVPLEITYEVLGWLAFISWSIGFYPQVILNFRRKRVLAYLLLSVVRIYSRKVEYLFDDCNEVLLDIKKFVSSTKDNAPAEMLCAAFNSVIIPDRFELDAFDMGCLEDVSGEHLASHKEITLKGIKFVVLDVSLLYFSLYNFTQFQHDMEQNVQSGTE